MRILTIRLLLRQTPPIVTNLLMDSMARGLMESEPNMFSFLTQATEFTLDSVGGVIAGKLFPDAPWAGGDDPEKALVFCRRMICRDAGGHEWFACRVMHVRPEYGYNYIGLDDWALSEEEFFNNDLLFLESLFREVAGNDPGLGLLDMAESTGLLLDGKFVNASMLRQALELAEEDGEE